MAEDKDALHLGPAEVEESVLQPQLLVGLGSVHLKRWRGCGVVEHQIGCPDLDRPGLQLRVFLAREPRRHGALDPHHIFVAQLAGTLLQLGAGVGLEDDLRQAVTVAKVDEHESPEITPGIDPATEHNGLPDLVFRQVSAGMSPFQ